MDDIQKELRVRSRIVNIYNKRREDFDSKEAWDDYLETMEDIVYNLVNRIDVQETEAKVAEYKRTNQLNIIANQARQAEEQKVQQAPAEVAQTPAEAHVGTGPAYSTFKPQTLLAAQPQPVQAPAVNADGGLIIPRMSKADFLPMANASGWTTDLPKARALQEAFASLLTF